MRILHVYKDYFPIVGGIENHVKLLAEGQAARGHRVTVLVTSLDRRNHEEPLNGVRVIYASRLFNISSAPVSLELVRNISRLNADITHLHSPYPIGEAANYFFGQGQATVLTYHSDIVRQRVMGALYMPLLHRVLARVTTIIATSPNYIQSSPTLSRWRAKCVVVPLGVAPLSQWERGLGDASSRNTENVGRSGLRRDDASGGEGNNNHLLFVGKLRYYKGLNDLLEAITLLPDVRLTVVGSGPMERMWKNLARELAVDTRVDWVGEVSDDELPAYYAACDVFVLPASARSEAFGAVQLEAMAAGKPVVSCDVGTGVAWVNQNGVTGLVVPPHNARALANAISHLIQDPALRAKMGAAGHARVRAEFTVDKMIERVMQVYERALIP